MSELAAHGETRAMAVVTSYERRCRTDLTNPGRAWALLSIAWRLIAGADPRTFE